MTDIAIRVDNLGKMYRIGHRERHDTLRDALVHGFWPRITRMTQRVRRNSGNSSHSWQDDILWALKDVSFEVKRGEVVGIIGRNGAGKSTLLKILSRITEPTTGRVDMYGRVGSLLEVGTGFHPELTGRENIYLSGAILGMKRAEIDRRYDEIVAFAEIERFLDTPVKRYSSGMYVRLAFAVAAHLEPEILLVDEVLAVGDAAFQKKCLGKMGDVAHEGRTVLFVSHNMAAVQNLCRRGVLLEQGQVTSNGPVDGVVPHYIRSLKLATERGVVENEQREGNGRLRFKGFYVKGADGSVLDCLASGQDVLIELPYRAASAIAGSQVAMSVGFYSFLGQPLFLCRSDLQGTEYVDLPPTGSVFCRIPRLPLPPGEFTVNLHCEINGSVADWVRNAASVTVIEGDYYGSGRLPSQGRGDLLVEHYWLAAIAHEGVVYRC